MNIDQILAKLTTTPLSSWTIEEHKQLLEMYLLISKHEPSIYKMIYRYHGCDSYEDIFRDYDRQWLNDKKNGVQVAIDEIDELLKK
jgi:hypothetical protein